MLLHQFPELRLQVRNVLPVKPVRINANAPVVPAAHRESPVPGEGVVPVGNLPLVIRVIPAIPTLPVSPLPREHRHPVVHHDLPVQDRRIWSVKGKNVRS